MQEFLGRIQKITWRFGKNSVNYIYIDRSTSRPGYGFSKKKLNHVCFRAKG
jgi:hypothetical protein